MTFGSTAGCNIASVSEYFNLFDIRAVNPASGEVLTAIAEASLEQVARWIGHWQGYMPNRLPKGTLVAIAPRYKTASAQLSLAEAAAQGLVDKLGAQRVGGREQAQVASQGGADGEDGAFFSQLSAHWKKHW